MAKKQTLTTDTATVKPLVLEKWVEDLEKFYPNTGDQVIEWRRDGAKKLFNHIYNVGINDGEIFAYAKRNIRISNDES